MTKGQNMDAQTEQSTTENTADTGSTDTTAAAIAAMEAAVAAGAPADDGEAEAPEAAAEDPAKVEAAPAEPEKPAEPLSPQMAALAKREKRIVEREQKAKAEHAEREKALAEKIAALGTVEELGSLARTGKAKELAEKLALDKEGLMALAKALWYEGVGEALPPDLKAAAEARELREEQARLKKQIEQERTAREQERHDAKVHAARSSYAAQIQAHLSTQLDGAPLVRAFAEEDASSITQQLFMLGIQHAEANPDEPVMGPADLVALLEQELELQVAPLKKRGFLNVGPKVESKSEPEAKAPSALTNQRAATASKKRTADLSDEERFKAALKAMDEASAIRG